MLASFTAGVEYQRGDVNQDGSVDIRDVTRLIDYLLTDSWGDEPVAPENETFTVNGVTFKMIGVEGGTFMMGATSQQYAGNDWEYPVHQVTLSDYSIGETEVTQALWLAVMGSNPSAFRGDLNRPVEQVSWNDCQTFISKLNELTGRQFRLPTEAEWEFAGRGGNKSMGYIFAGSNVINEVAWYNGNATSPQPVATKAPNELGLYDMSGNVWEYCYDWFDYYSSNAQTDPTGPASGYERVTRGGGWYGPDIFCFLWTRSGSAPNESFFNIGLRIAL